MVAAAESSVGVAAHVGSTAAAGAAGAGDGDDDAHAGYGEVQARRMCRRDGRRVPIATRSGHPTTPLLKFRSPRFRILLKAGEVYVCRNESRGAASEEQAHDGFGVVWEAETETDIAP